MVQAQICLVDCWKDFARSLIEEMSKMKLLQFFFSLMDLQIMVWTLNALLCYQTLCAFFWPLLISFSRNISVEAKCYTQFLHEVMSEQVYISVMGKPLLEIIIVDFRAYSLRSKLTNFIIFTTVTIQALAAITIGIWWLIPHYTKI